MSAFTCIFAAVVALGVGLQMAGSANEVTAKTLTLVDSDGKPRIVLSGEQASVRLFDSNGKEMVELAIEGEKEGSQVEAMKVGAPFLSMRYGAARIVLKFEDVPPMSSEEKGDLQAVVEVLNCSAQQDPAVGMGLARLAAGTDRVSLGLSRGESLPTPRVVIQVTKSGEFLNLHDSKGALHFSTQR